MSDPERPESETAESETAESETAESETAESESPEGSVEDGQEDIEEQDSPYVLGIDLGTCNSEVAISLRGEPRVFKVAGDELRCPSVVHSLSEDEFLVGRAARAQLMADPKNTVASIKRLMGTSEVVRFDNRPGKEYTPAQISSEILGRLIQATEASDVDLAGTPRRVVICVPANFNEAQKRATIDAAELVNLRVLYLLEEPVAAAIAYASETARDQKILIYDLGGGTFDVAILEVDSTRAGADRYRITAKDGVPELGGDDFDRKIMEIAAARFDEAIRAEGGEGVDLLDIQKDQGINLKALRAAQQKLKDAAERAKCDLSQIEEVRITIPDLIKDGSGKVWSLDTTITRAEFEAAIEPLVLQSKEAVDRALRGDGGGIEGIDRIILVGGSTRVPCVKRMLTDLFDGREPYTDRDRDTVVARGAAVLGAQLATPEDPDQPLAVAEITNIVTHHLGIEVSGGRFSQLIEKDAEISPDAPLTASRDYSTPRDNMRELLIGVYQSAAPAEEPPEFVRAEDVKCIGEFYVTGIPARPKGEAQIRVTFEIDRQNLLQVTAGLLRETESGEKELVPEEAETHALQVERT